MSLEDATTAELERVARLVAEALERAGIPWSPTEQPLDHDVAQVIVDDSDDDDRGVFVSWTLSVQENSAMHALVVEGDHANPAILQAGRRFEEALDRIQRVLRGAGIASVNPEDDFDPYMLKIVSAP
ncbi:hypothetical protein [Glycomyces sp. NRRL B-16210]|uniref:hypothetical protein n=1 Tax=Glycomyces sp. NRRL B-16210 TaxID=1463821 RepID=UPI0004BE9F22|nr:hypothetical protein [Glycomyces sp. NRRL B-16210]